MLEQKFDVDSAEYIVQDILDQYAFPSHPDSLDAKELGLIVASRHSGIYHGLLRDIPTA